MDGVGCIVVPFTYLRGNTDIFCVSGKAECFTYQIMYMLCVFWLEKYALKSVSFMMNPLVDCSFH